ncbi:hypothetical protein SAMN02745121_00231 [Nannocystis exedens]|uniref:Repeat domain-containing protein n=1 Tax=Nannocystis exedens TaxID=54 RepID=A0A1I1SSB0_9BACT|nr:VCBS repeat-containing protein [Nannocystis exedens]PCC75691.1 FG-GAP repeat/HVR domain protein [Nannocystis exedens]SFD49296.1 hypothetical protein SAMN02745121_00231 [Nannocystis exedens]
MSSSSIFRTAPRCLSLGLSVALVACSDDSTGTSANSATAATTGDGPTGSATASPTGTATEVPTGTTDSGTGSATGTSTTGPVDETTAETVSGSTTTATGTTTSTGSTNGETTTGNDTTGEPVDLCKVSDDMDAVVPCVDEAPPNSFEPDIQWAWPGQDGDTQVAVTVAVANLTDDNGDGAIDLCDVPDIVVPAYAGPEYLNDQGNLYVLDGATGAVHYKVANVGAITYPAIADIDADGVPEILTGRPSVGNSLGRLLALEHDGTEKWVSAVEYDIGSSAIAVADLDNDGDVEIVHHGSVFDHTGALLWQAPNSTSAYINTMADLDGDDDMEVILGPTAYHHDGTLYYSVPIGDGHPQVADLDADGEPEVLVVTIAGLALIEHNGALTYANQVPDLAVLQAASIHDFDGDMQPEFAVSSGSTYSVFELDLTPKWTASIQDSSGYASSTAFDFLGDGTAEAMYADETSLFIFDGMGQPYLTSPRGSWTQFEMPIVVDVDNDASAEIVVVSNLGYNNSDAPPIQVIRDKMDRWIPARRIWNQHTYHVTNVREDGTIPQVEPKSWKNLNTFRTQAQVSLGGGVCLPEPQ